MQAKLSGDPKFASLESLAPGANANKCVELKVVLGFTHSSVSECFCCVDHQGRWCCVTGVFTEQEIKSNERRKEEEEMKEIKSAALAIIIDVPVILLVAFFFKCTTCKLESFDWRTRWPCGSPCGSRFP